MTRYRNSDNAKSRRQVANDKPDQQKALVTKKLFAACILALPLCSPFGVQGQENAVTIGSLLEGLKNSLGKGANQPPDQPNSVSNAPTIQPNQNSLSSALPKYTKLIQELAARGDLPSHSWGKRYLQDRTDVQAYTVSSIPGMYSLRNVRPENIEEAKKWADASGLLFEWKPITLFTGDGSGFYVRKDNSTKGSDSWIVYDKNAGGYKTGEAARPYIQQMLTNIDTKDLPSVGNDRPTFILYTSPSCPYSGQVEPLLKKTGLSYRIFPTWTNMPTEDLPEVHRIFCAPDKLAAWKESLAVQKKYLDQLRKSPGTKTRNYNDGSWWCNATIMPVYTLSELDFIFGQGYSTPSYYFPDGTVISGANNIEAVKAKSREMVAKNLHFK